jgi:hypothetical protein
VDILYLFNLGALGERERVWLDGERGWLNEIVRYSPVELYTHVWIHVVDIHICAYTRFSNQVIIRDDSHVA